MTQIKSIALTLATFLGAASVAHATTLDFDSTVASGTSFTESGVTISVDDPSSTLRFLNAPGGSRALVSSGPDPDFWIAQFSSLMDFVSVDLGDYGADADTIFLEAYSATDTLLGTAEQNLAASFEGMVTLSLARTAISYVHFGVRGGGIYADNLTFTAGSPAPIPLPAGLPLLLAGLGGLAVVARRRTST